MEESTSSAGMPSLITDDRPVRPITAAGLADAAQEEQDMPGHGPIARDDFTVSEFQPGSATKHAGTWVAHWAMTVARTKAELLIVAQLAYWLGVARDGRLRARIRRGGHWWICKTYGKLGRELFLTKGATRGAMRSLKERGIVIEAGVRSAGEIPIYRLCPVAIARIIKAASSSTDEIMEDDGDEV